MTAIDAYHMREGIFETLHTEHMGRFARFYTASLRGEVEETMPSSYSADLLPFISSGDAYLAREVRVMKMAETFYVAPLMNSMVTAAAEAWPDDEPVTAEDWPTYAGFMYVPGGVSTIDIRGQVNTTVAFAWEVVGGATTVTWWTDKHFDPPAMRTREGWADAPRFTPWHVTYLQHGHALPTGLVMGTVIPPEVGEKMQWVTNAKGRASLIMPIGFEPDTMKPHITVDRVSAWLVSALRIMQQPLAAVERHGIPAAVRKASMRKRIRLKQKAVTVIDFRRRESDFEHHGDREYSHRFLRRGHWRRQPYKRDDGTWDRRRIWIHATIVGDPEKPLILRNHVNALSR